MNYLQMAWLDRWIGQPVCLGLTIFRRAKRLILREPPADGPPQKILILKLIEQGATVLADSAIQRAIELVGKENVYFLVFEQNRAVLDLMGLIAPENILAVQSKEPMLLARDLVAAIAKIRSIGIDTVIDMELFSRGSAIIGYLTGAERRVGHHRFTTEGPYRGDLLTHRVQLNPYLHIADVYRMLVESALRSGDEWPLAKMPVSQSTFAPTRFAADAADDERLRAELRLPGGEAPSPLVLLNSNASDLLPIRRWAGENFASLARKILDDYPEARIVLTGGPEEREPGDRLAAELASPRVKSLAGRTTMRELLTLYTIADLLVTNDSGPGHFASLTDIDCIILFGPETPKLYAPRGEHTHVMWAELACSPCVNAMNHRISPCNDAVCMKSLTVPMVHEKVRQVLDRRTRRQRPKVDVKVFATDSAVKATV